MAFAMDYICDTSADFVVLRILTANWLHDYRGALINPETAFWGAEIESEPGLSSGGSPLDLLGAHSLSAVVVDSNFASSSSRWILSNFLKTRHSVVSPSLFLGPGVSSAVPSFLRFNQRFLRTEPKAAGYPKSTTTVIYALERLPLEHFFFATPGGQKCINKCVIR